MLSRAKKDLTALDLINEPLFRAVEYMYNKYGITHISVTLLIRIKTFQTLHNRFIQPREIQYDTMRGNRAYKIYVAELVNAGLIECIRHTGLQSSGYNVTPKGEHTCTSITRLYNQYKGEIIRAHDLNRIRTKDVPHSKFSKYFGKVKNPNTDKKNIKKPAFQTHSPKAGELQAKRAKLRKEAQEAELQKIKNIKTEVKDPINKSSNPFK